jgi:TolB protein
MTWALCGLMIAALIPQPSMAQSSNGAVSVVKSPWIKINVGAFSGNDASAARTLLITNLIISGKFQTTTEKSELIPEIRASLAKTAAGWELQGQVISGDDSWGKRYTDSKETVYNRLIHAFANDIIQRLANQKGFAGTRIICSYEAPGAKPPRKGRPIPRELAILDCDGGRFRTLTNDQTLNLSPKWSADGRKFIYTTYLKYYSDLVMVDMTTLKRTRVSAQPGLNVQGAISPDGSKLAMILSRDGTPELYTQDLMGGNLKRLTWDKAVEASPTWAPDGRSLIFTSDLSGTPQLYQIGLAGGKGKRLTRDGTDNNAPEWSPASGLVVYSSRRGGFYQICVFNPKTGQEIQQTFDMANHEDPAWAPDGQHVVYVKKQGGRSSLQILDTLTRHEIGLSPAAGNFYTPHWAP